MMMKVVITVMSEGANPATTAANATKAVAQNLLADHPILTTDEEDVTAKGKAIWTEIGTWTRTDFATLVKVANAVAAKTETGTLTADEVTRIVAAVPMQHLGVVALNPMSAIERTRVLMLVMQLLIRIRIRRGAPGRILPVVS